MMMTTIRECLECGTRIGGRADKKFCSDACRVTHNNRLNTDETSYMRCVNHILRKNRRILMALNPEGKSKVSLLRMKMKGFDFNYFTSVYQTKEGAHYYYCYDQGYLPMEKDLFLLVVKKDF
jgi:predicted nucleic acid-binding Zn ribbon protein